MIRWKEQLWRKLNFLEFKWNQSVGINAHGLKAWLKPWLIMRKRLVILLWYVLFIDRARVYARVSITPINQPIQSIYWLIIIEKFMEQHASRVWIIIMVTTGRQWETCPFEWNAILSIVCESLSLYFLILWAPDHVVATAKGIAAGRVWERIKGLPLEGGCLSLSISHFEVCIIIFIEQNSILMTLFTAFDFPLTFSLLRARPKTHTGTQLSTIEKILCIIIITEK